MSGRSYMSDRDRYLLTRKHEKTHSNQQGLPQAMQSVRRSSPTNSTISNAARDTAVQDIRNRMSSISRAEGNKSSGGSTGTSSQKREARKTKTDDTRRILEEAFRRKTKTK